MADQCQTEINGLPILTGCIGDNELLLVMNSTAAGNNGGYGLRYARDVRNCFLSGLQFKFLQFTIGQAGSLMSPGDLGFTLNAVNVLQDSIFVTLDGTELPRNLNTEISYTLTYNAGGVTFLFNQAASLGQDYIIHYSASIGSLTPPVPSGSSNSGNSVQNGTGTQAMFVIPHGLPGAPSFVNVNAGSGDALSSAFYLTTDATNIYVNYSIAPPTGSSNLTFYWEAKI